MYKGVSIVGFSLTLFSISISCICISHRIFLVVFSVIPFEFCFVDLHTISCLVGPSVHVSFVLLDSSLYVGGACTRFNACLVVLVFKCAGVMHVVVRSIVAFDT